LKTITLRLPIIFVLVALIAAACTPAAVPTATEAPLPTATAELGDEPVAATQTPQAEQGMPIEPGKNVLVLIKGEARITHDNGGSWTVTGTGQYLEAGDEVQLTGDSLALLFLFNGAVIRLEGASDFELQLAEKDDETGATQIIGRLWEGHGLFETNPLPTPDSLFQLYALTSFIDVDYDAELAQAVDGSFDLDPERTIIAGGTLDDEDEDLYIYRGPATIYVLGWDDYDQDYVAEVYPAENEQVIQVEIDFLVDPRLEANIEGFLDIAGTLVRQYMQGGEVGGEGILGYSLDEVEILNTGETTIFFLSGLDAQGLVTEFETNDGSRVNLIVTASLEYVNGFPQVANVEVMVMAGNDNGFGCDPNTGTGCKIPEGCDLDSGEGCALPSGCNLITKQGCSQTHVSCEIVIQTDDLGIAIGAELVCPESIQLDCDPNLAGDCDGSYDETTWADWDDDDDEDWCWCRATLPPGFPPPPPWMDMTYRCWCSDPGASPNRP